MPVQVAAAGDKPEAKQADGGGTGGNPFLNPGTTADEKEPGKKKDTIKITLPALQDEEQ